MERTRERVPLDWTETQNNLAGALVHLGSRGTGTAKLEEAVIPNPIDQNPWAHWRSPMDMMRQG